AVQREQIHEPQRQKRALTQTHLGRGGWLIGDPLKENGMRQPAAARQDLSAHRTRTLELMCREARPSHTPTYRSRATCVRPQMARFRAFRRVFRMPEGFP